MILRHITQVKNLPNIINENCLNPKYNNKFQSSDKEYISFEMYQNNDAMLKCYIQFKNIKKEEAFQLFFDSDKMIKDGIKIVTKFENEGKHTNIELQMCVPKTITQDEYDSIGDYKFVKGPVSLKYLTEKSCQDLNEWNLKHK